MGEMEKEQNPKMKDDQKKTGRNDSLFLNRIVEKKTEKYGTHSQKQ